MVHGCRVGIGSMVGSRNDHVALKTQAAVRRSTRADTPPDLDNCGLSPGPGSTPGDSRRRCLENFNYLLEIKVADLLTS